MITRCEWVPLGDQLYIDYHDREWGVPVHDDRLLFEAIVLDGAQAGLSWATILRKREAYREAFDNFDAERIADYDDTKIAELLTNPGIVRNRRKIESAIGNAKAFLTLRDERDGFDKCIWQFVGGITKRNSWKCLSDIPASTPESVEMSKFLLARGFTFVGPTICYAFMQAVGMVNDHQVDCFRYGQV